MKVAVGSGVSVPFGPAGLTAEVGVAIRGLRPGNGEFEILKSLEKRGKLKDFVGRRGLAIECQTFAYLVYFVVTLSNGPRSRGRIEGVWESAIEDWVPKRTPRSSFH